MDKLFCIKKSSKSLKNNSKTKMKTIHILKAEYIGDLSIKIYFEDKSNIVNIGNYITRNPHPQYNKYLDEKNVKKFKLENGNIVWGKNWDLIFPLDQLYNGTVN